MNSNQEAQTENLINETNEQYINETNIVNEVINTLD